jgi:hypothetical protein
MTDEYVLITTDGELNIHPNFDSEVLMGGKEEIQDLFDAAIEADASAVIVMAKVLRKTELTYVTTNYEDRDA